MGEVRIDERGEGVLLATISNPPHALMDDAIVVALEQLAARAESDPAVTGIVLTGEHPERFVAHYDVGELLAGARQSPSVSPRAARVSLGAVSAIRGMPGGKAALERTPADGLSQAERFGEVFVRLNTCGAVVTAAINGSAMGGGCELALACDLRLMAAGPFGIGQPEILLGFPPGGGGTQRLTRMLGTRRALEICLEGAPLAPAEAAEIGLIDEVVPGEELIDRALAATTRLAARPKAGIAALKRAVYLGGSMPFEAGLRLERAEFMAALVNEASQEAMAAYVDATEQSGELPLYDEQARADAVERGRFA
ncbi:MAG: enoyl-CoA hydratase/isomerase family protein [Solirubrobacterales bacterium]|nr:enoyl-CoA hydratase/isomerase family protein [Solirubrobacterales bacterium]